MAAGPTVQCMASMSFNGPLDVAYTPDQDLPDRVFYVRVDPKELRSELMAYAEEFVRLLGRVPEATAERMERAHYLQSSDGTK